jgi:hypothetical protein
MINADTWFYFKNPEAINEIALGEANFASSSYCIYAKKIVDRAFQSEIESFNFLQKLSENEKAEIIDGVVLDFKNDLNNETILKDFISEEDDTSVVRNFISNFLFPMQNHLTYVDFDILIKCLLDSNNNPDLFYIDTYSIYKLAQMFYNQKSMFAYFEKKHPSETERKSTYRNITEIKTALISNQEGIEQSLSIEQKFYAEFMGKFVQTDQEKLLLESSHSSQAKSAKSILKEIPSRIITMKEINNNGSISYKINKTKNSILFSILGSFYPDKRNYSTENFPHNISSTFDKYVDSTVKQKFY